MPFDPARFEAEVALKLIPTEELPMVAQNALEAGFDGPHVVRMAILDPKYGWAIDQALPLMLKELGCNRLTPQDAALHLAQEHARHLLDTGENPLSSLPYFYRLMLAANYPTDLIELGFLEDNFDYFFDDPDEQRTVVLEALQNLLSPELRQERKLQRQAIWERTRAKTESEWPYVLDSPSGRALLKERFIERIIELRPLLWIELAAWIVLGWAFSSWRAILIGFVTTVPLMLILAIWAVYRQMKFERRDTLLRLGVPDDKIYASTRTRP